MTFPVSRDGIRWIVTIPYAQREHAKSAGFRWCPDRKHWWTSREDVAKLLMDPAAQLAKKSEFERIGKERAAFVDESRAASADVELPAPDGLEYLPFQKAGIASALKRGNVLFGDDMGLGKTIQVIGMINARPDVKRVLIVCPATLKQNWQRELNKWLVRKFRIGIASGQSWPGGYADIVIMNFDIATKHAAKIQAELWDLVAIDEAHYLKNRESKRTLAIFGMDPYTAKRQKVKPSPGVRGRLQIGMTGTPIPNRPSEGFGLFHWLAPDHESFRSFYVYAKKFTGSFGYPGAGYDQNGATNLDELQRELRGSIMIRRTKTQVLTELPAKRRVVIELEADSASDAIADESEAAESHEEELERLRAAVELAKAESEEAYTAAVAALKKGASFAFTEMARLRHETAMATLPHAVEHVLTALRADEKHKVVVFCWHQDVVNSLLETFNRLHGPDLREVGSSSKTAKSGQRISSSPMQVQVRSGKGSASFHASTGSINRMPELSPDEARSCSLPRVSPPNERIDAGQARKATVRPGTERHHNPDSLPSFGDSDFVHESEVLRQQSIFGSDNSSSGLRERKCLDHQLESERDKARRHTGGTGHDCYESSEIAVSITGSTPIGDRQAIVDRFQTDPDCRVFIGNIMAAGVGITLTAAWHVVFVELDWVPGNMSQAEDRCNRIGQRNSVLCEHLVIQGSIAATMAKRLVSKQNVIDSALDREHPERLTPEQIELMDAPIVPGRSEAATQDTPRTKYAKIAETLTVPQIAAIHQALRMIADLDGDHAKVLNGIGFSRLDGMIGHSLADCGRLTPKQAALAQTLVRKYRRQVPDALLAECGL